ncbi:penicillin-insensitive murein endopeptidase [bacterium]|nr:penicillin-insensitive murein endopeptidase [bacterium]
MNVARFVRPTGTVVLLLITLTVLALAPPAFAADESPDVLANREPETIAELLAVELGLDLESAMELAAGASADGVLFEDEVDEDLADSAFTADDIDLTGRDLSSLPCLSVGSASRGRLVNGIKMTSSPGIRVRSGSNNYGTPETIAALRYAVAKVHENYPDSHDLLVGDISAPGGGRLKRHRSHQAGRDVDISMYYRNGGQPATFIAAGANNLDVPRTWAFLEALMEDNKTEYVFLDAGVQRILRDYVKYKLKASPEYLDRVFSIEGRPRQALIRHARGHRNHIHVRFWSPIAVANARKYDFRDAHLAKLQGVGRDVLQGDAYVAREDLGTVDNGEAPAYRLVKEWKTVPVAYRVRSGDTLSTIAKRNRVGTAKLMKWNRLSGKSVLRPGQKITIYKRQLVEEHVAVPAEERAALETGSGTADSAPAPAIDTVTAEAAANAATGEAAPIASVPAAPTTKVVWKNSYHKVRSGDNLWSIAKKYGTTIEKICALNKGLSKKSKLKLGRSIKVKSWKETVVIDGVSSESGANSGA